MFDPQIIPIYLKTTKSEWGVQACKCTRVKTNERKIGLHVPTRYRHTSGIHATIGVNKKIESQSQIRPKMCITWEADYILA